MTGLFVVAALLAPSPSSAVTKIVYVDIKPGALKYWPSKSAVEFVDLYTGSDMRYGACRSGYKCITIRERTFNTSAYRSSWSAVTYGANTSRVEISVNGNRRYAPYNYNTATKKSIIAHELGHANGLYSHSSSCTNIMYARVFCNESRRTLPPLKFLAADKARLKAN